jgi:hypothetical protein
MDTRCGCGEGAGPYDLGCLECGAGCCPACAVSLESTTYCLRCAMTLLGAVPAAAPEGSFELH